MIMHDMKTKGIIDLVVSGCHAYFVCKEFFVYKILVSHLKIKTLSYTQVPHLLAVWQWLHARSISCMA